MRPDPSQRLRCTLPAQFVAEPRRDIALAPFHNRHARDVHALLVDAYAAGAGIIDPYEEWRREFVNDVEFDAASCFLAFRGERLCAVALCWASAFVKDLAVTRAERGRGLGTFLLRRVCDHFAERGASAVDLKVKLANGDAMRLYRRLGFEPVEPEF